MKSPTGIPNWNSETFQNRKQNDEDLKIEILVQPPVMYII